MPRLKIRVILFLILSACASKEQAERRVIVGLVGCGEPEAVVDIQYSLEKIKPNLQGKIDTVYLDVFSSSCGYKFIQDEDSTTIFGAHTDADLMLEVRKYFHID